MDFAELIVDVKQRQTIQSLNKIEGKLNSLEKNAKNVGVAFLAGWSFTKIIGLLDGFGRSLQARNVAARQFGVIFSGSMNLASASVRRLQGELLKTETQARNMMSVIGARIPEIGFNSETITKISTDIAVLAENTAAAMGKNVDEVIQKFTNALAGQTKGLRDVGIYVDKNSESFKTQVVELEKSLGLTQKQAEVMATLNQMLESGNKFTGAAKENINTITGALENLKNTFNDIVGSKVGQIFSTLLSPLVNIISSILNIPFVAWITAISIASVSLLGIWKAISTIFGKLSGYIFTSLHNKVSKVLELSNAAFYIGLKQKKNVEDILKQKEKQVRRERELAAIQLYRLQLMEKYKKFGYSQQQAAVEAGDFGNLYRKRGRQGISGVIQSYESTQSRKKLPVKYSQISQQFMQAFGYSMQMSSNPVIKKFGDNIAGTLESVGTFLYMKSEIEGSKIWKGISSNLVNLFGSLSKFNLKFGKWADTFVDGVSNFIAQLASKKIGSTVGNVAGQVAGGVAGGAAGASIGLGAKIGTFFKGLAKNLIKWIGVGLAAMFKLVWTGLTLAVKGIWSVVSSTAFAFVTGIAAAATAIIFAVDALYTMATTDLDPREVWSYLMQPLADWWEGTEQAQQEVKKHAEYAKSKIKEWQTTRKTQLEPVLKSYANFLRDVVNVKDFKEVVNNRKINDLQVTRQQYLKYMEQLRRTIDDGPAGVFNEDERMKARQEAAEKLKTAMQNYSKIQKQIEQLENENYSMRNKWYNDRLGEEENFRKQTEDIFKEMSTTAQQRNLRIKHLQQELAKMSEATLQKVYGGTWGKGANMKPEDRIALYRKQEAIITQEAKLRIEALKEEYEITKNMRTFISDMMKKMLEFKSTTVDAIQANTVEGQKFASSKVGNINLQQSLLNQNYAEQKNLQTRILNVQNNAYKQLVKINSNIVNLMNKIAGFRVENNLI